MRFSALLLSLTASVCLAAAPPKEVKGKVVAIADGDTITVLDADKVQHTVRLHGVDAPEKGQDYGAKSKAALGKLVFEKDVTVAVTDADRYKRLVGKVTVGRLRVVRWGNRDRAERKLPPTGWTWKASVEEGKWAAMDAEPVLVPANYLYAGGVWFRVKEGVDGLLVRTRAGDPVVYLVTEPATRYYRVMTRQEWMPTLVGEVI